MQVEEFNFHLPKELIAQRPLKNREDSRLMVINRKEKKVEHKQFKDLFGFINQKDVIVFNSTKVIPARLFGNREGKNEKIEVLLTKEIENERWEVLAKPAKKLKSGAKINFGKDFSAEVKKTKKDGQRILKFNSEKFWKDLERFGIAPTPPYIKEILKKQESSRYQTVFSKEYGSSAAPTAGLHFTKEILDKIPAKKVFVDLKIGLDTFQPVRSEIVEEHEIHGEYFCLTQENADLLNETRKNNGKIVCVGTTSARVLETCADESGIFKAKSGETKIFIYPPYQFRGVDIMLTNFHLPKSTLIMMISALAGKDLVFSAYKQAIKEKYRFFSFGDAMLII